MSSAQPDAAVCSSWVSAVPSWSLQAARSTFACTLDSWTRTVLSAELGIAYHASHLPHSSARSARPVRNTSSSCCDTSACHRIVRCQLRAHQHHLHMHQTRDSSNSPSAAHLSGGSPTSLGSLQLLQWQRPSSRAVALFGRHASSKSVHACNNKRALLRMAAVHTAWHLQQLVQHKQHVLCCDRSQRIQVAKLLELGRQGKLHYAVQVEAASGHGMSLRRIDGQVKVATRSSRRTSLGLC